MALNLLIPDEWLREFIDTKANPKQIEKYLSLCGPSVERVEKRESTFVYHIEITTNRVDTASVFGIAREACAILPRFGIKAELVKRGIELKQKFTNKVGYLDVEVDTKLCPRFTAVLIKGVKQKESPSRMKKRLSLVGARPINNIVDISNYIMYEIGQPVHTFDYDKIVGAKMILRESKRGETIKTLDGEEFILPGGDIVIEDGSGSLIDLAGIMGGLNSAVDKNTKNVLLFVQTYNPVNIRRTSMTLAKRTDAAVLFEKGLDTELVTLGISRGIDLFEKLTGGNVEQTIIDIYPSPYKTKTVETTLSFIEQRLGITIQKSKVSRLLEALGLKTQWRGNKLKVSIPSFRAKDIDIQEDIVEEVARIYGYHNLPSELTGGKIPEAPANSLFEFEIKIKQALKGWGGFEVYTLSLVSEQEAGKNALKLKNPLGADSEYLRTSLLPSLVKAAEQNSGEKEPFHLFEMANIYLPKKGNLPEEKMNLAGIFSNYEYREAKGVIEALLNELKIDYRIEQSELPEYLPSRGVEIKSGKDTLGKFGIITMGNFIYYEFDLEKLRKHHKSISTYRPIPKYPPQIEDITLILPEKTRIGDVIQSIKSVDKTVNSVELTDIYKNAYTFRVQYQHADKTLTDEEIEVIRAKILNNLRLRFGASQK